MPSYVPVLEGVVAGGRLATLCVEEEVDVELVTGGNEGTLAVEEGAEGEEELGTGGGWAVELGGAGAAVVVGGAGAAVVGLVGGAAVDGGGAAAVVGLSEVLDFFVPCAKTLEDTKKRERTTAGEVVRRIVDVILDLWAPESLETSRTIQDREQDLNMLGLISGLIVSVIHVWFCRPSLCFLLVRQCCAMQSDNVISPYTTLPILWILVQWMKEK